MRSTTVASSPMILREQSKDRAVYRTACPFVKRAEALTREWKSSWLLEVQRLHGIHAGSAEGRVERAQQAADQPEGGRDERPLPAQVDGESGEGVREVVASQDGQAHADHHSRQADEGALRDH